MAEKSRRRRLLEEAAKRKLREQGRLIDDGIEAEPFAAAPMPQPQPTPTTERVIRGRAVRATPAGPSRGLRSLGPQTRADAAQGRQMLAKGADDLVRSIAAGATFGFADELAAAGDTAIGRGTFQENLARQAERDRDIPLAIALPGQVAGGFMTGGAAVRAFPQLANLARATTRGGAAGRAAAVGAGTGAVSGAGFAEGDLENRFKGGLVGAIFGGLTGGVLGGTLGNRARTSLQAADEAIDEVAARSSNLYRQVDAATQGGFIKNEAVRRLHSDLIGELAEEGFDTNLHPRAAQALNRIAQDADSPAGLHTLKDIEILRRVTIGAARDAKPDDARMAGLIRTRIDDFLTEDLARSENIVGNLPKSAIDNLTEARTLWRTKSKADDIRQAIALAELQSTQFSQSGLENALRTQFRALARRMERNKSYRARFTEGERELIKRVNQGESMTNLFRWLGKFRPSGVVSSAVSVGGGASAGGAVAGPGGAAIGAATLPTVGAVGRNIAEDMTINAAEHALARVLAGQGRVPPGGISQLGPRAAFVAPVPASEALARLNENRERAMRAGGLAP